MIFVRRLLATNAPAAVILIRLIVGGVFLSEGISLTFLVIVVSYPWVIP